VAISYIGGRNLVPWENHWPAASHWQNLSHNVVSSTSRLSGVLTQRLWWEALIAQVVVNSTTILSQPWWPLILVNNSNYKHLPQISMQYSNIFVTYYMHQTRIRVVKPKHHLCILWKSEWVMVVSSTSEQYFSFIMVRTS
jgi:hypothetical protein